MLLWGGAEIGFEQKKVANMVDVLVADHHAVVRGGLKAFLASTKDLQIVGEAGSAGELFELLTRVACDVVVLEINLPDMNGLDVLKHIKRERSNLPVLIFSIFSEDDFAIPAINDGASGYLAKDSPPEHILMALRTIRGALRNAGLGRDPRPHAS